MIKTGTPLIFPFLLGRAFIEALDKDPATSLGMDISLPFGKGFH